MASTSIPGAFSPIRYRDHYLADGAISSNTPIRVAVRKGAKRLIVLPTGHACADEDPPVGAVANALHALTLLIARQLVSELEGLGPDIEYFVVPPLCPLVGSPYDFSRTADHIDRAIRDHGCVAGAERAAAGRESRTRCGRTATELARTVRDGYAALQKSAARLRPIMRIDYARQESIDFWRPYLSHPRSPGPYIVWRLLQSVGLSCGRTRIIWPRGLMETLLIPFSPRYIILTICAVVTALLIGIGIFDNKLKVWELLAIPIVIFGGAHDCSAFATSPRRTTRFCAIIRSRRISASCWKRSGRRCGSISSRARRTACRSPATPARWSISAPRWCSTSGRSAPRRTSTGRLRMDAPFDGAEGA